MPTHLAQGADGGSIPRRDELVKSKARATKHDPSLLAALALYYCSLTKDRLSPPIVADDLGKLYNREAVVKHLLDRRSSSADIDTELCEEIRHIKSLKDVTTLELTMISKDQPKADAAVEDDAHQPQFACPLTGRPLNGRHRFVYLRSCGHAMSLSGLRELVPAVGQGTAANEAAAAAVECPVCTKSFNLASDLIPLNPAPEELPALVERMLARQAAEGAAKRKRKASGKKRKVDSDGLTKGEPSSKMAKTASTSSKADPAANINMSLPAIPSRSSMGAQQSAVIASLYKKKDEASTTDAEKFFVQGTFSRT